MIEKNISRRGAFSLLGLAAALGFAIPTTLLTESDAEAQAQPTAPAPLAPTPSAPAPSGMEKSQERHTGRKKRREARHSGRSKRREARQSSRTGRREARQKSDKLYMKGDTTKQK
ncbi:MAG: hypothetical protein ACTHJS_16760 [Xanthobacteraceae bacterium]|jgi:hypothetical protein